MTDTPLAERLLDAHVAHLRQKLTGDQLPAHVEALIDQLLYFANHVKVASIVNKKDVTDTAVFFATKMDIGPGIPELIAEMARELYQHKAHDKASVNDLVSDHHFNELLEKFSEMTELRKRLIHEAVGNPIYGELVSDLLYNGITRYLNDNPLTNNLPGAKSMLKFGKSLMERTAGSQLEDGVKHYIKENTRAALRESERFLLQRLEPETVRKNGLRIWDRIKDKPVSRFRKHVAEDDVEEFFVIGFEFWKQFRETKYCAALIKAGVDFFFKKYGKTTLADLLNDIGVTRDMIITEALRYSPRIIAELDKHGFIDLLARSQLESFYQSKELKALLAE